MTVWDDIRGQDRVIGLLRHDVESGRVAHAYLFAGMAGRSPVRSALAFAAACVCERGGCGDCLVCRQVPRLAHPDVELIEPSGTQLLVDQVRDVVRSAWRVPVAGARRVVVVDQADRMNPNAQNAFLKALEEPPASTVIVLVTPSGEAMLETVRSRCREVTFHPPSEEQVAAELESDGVPRVQARAWAKVGGSLDRARELATDADARERRRALADRVLQATRDPGDALDAAEWLAGQTRSIRDRVAETHKAQAAEHADWYRETKKASEDRLRREQRRAEQDALESALDDVTSVLRDLLAATSASDAPLLNADLAAAVHNRATALAGRFPAILACLADVDEVKRRLRSNANVLLSLERVFLALHERLG
jgi:DNA polymerase-3 subunit delta'